MSGIDLNNSSSAGGWRQKALGQRDIVMTPQSVILPLKRSKALEGEVAATAVGTRQHDRQGMYCLRQAEIRTAVKQYFFYLCLYVMLLITYFRDIRNSNETSEDFDSQSNDAHSRIFMVDASVARSVDERVRSIGRVTFATIRPTPICVRSRVWEASWVVVLSSLLSWCTDQVGVEIPLGVWRIAN